MRTSSITRTRVSPPVVNFIEYPRHASLIPSRAISAFSEVAIHGSNPVSKSPFFNPNPDRSTVRLSAWARTAEKIVAVIRANRPKASIERR